MCEAECCCGGDVYAGAAGHVIQNHRQRRCLGDFAEVLIETLLRGLVVERSDRENRAVAREVLRREVVDHSPGAVAADAEHERDAAGDAVDDEIAHRGAFFGVERGCLAGGAQHDDVIRAACKQVIHNSFECIEIDVAFVVERCHQRDTESSEVYMVHKNGRSVLNTNCKFTKIFLIPQLLGAICLHGRDFYVIFALEISLFSPLFSSRRR